MIKLAVYGLLAFYLVGFVGVTWIEALAGPVTVPLAVLRGLMWPVYVTTGRPQGVRMTTDDCGPDDRECG